MSLNFPLCLKRTPKNGTGSVILNHEEKAHNDGKGSVEILQKYSAYFNFDPLPAPAYPGAANAGSV